MIEVRDGASAWRKHAGVRGRRCHALLGGTALATCGVLAALLAAPQSAQAACDIHSDANTVTCAADTTTTNTNNVDAASTSSSDRRQTFTQFGAVTGSVSSGVTVNGFGLEISNFQSGASGNITFTNDGTVKADAAGAQDALKFFPGTGGLLTVTNTGTLTGGTGGVGLTSSGGGSVSIGNTGTIGGDGGGINVFRSGAATVDITSSGTVTAPSGGAISAGTADGNGTVTITGGTVTGDGAIGVITDTGTAKVSVSGGTVSASHVAISIANTNSGAAVAEVTGGTVSATGNNSAGIAVDTNGSLFGNRHGNRDRDRRFGDGERRR